MYLVHSHSQAFPRKKWELRILDRRRKNKNQYDFILKIFLLYYEVKSIISVSFPALVSVLFYYLLRPTKNLAFHRRPCLRLTSHELSFPRTASYFQWWHEKSEWNRRITPLKIYPFDRTLYSQSLCFCSRRKYMTKTQKEININFKKCASHMYKTWMNFPIIKMRICCWVTLPGVKEWRWICVCCRSRQS